MKIWILKAQIIISFVKIMGNVDVTDAIMRRIWQTRDAIKKQP